MRLTSLIVKNIRAHKKYTLTIEPTITLITGANGSGKTSLLEAIYIALQGSSFKGSDDEVLRLMAPWYRIDLTFDDGSSRVVKFESDLAAKKKRFEINQKVNYRLPYAIKHPVILFDPDELRLLHGSPVRRRQFIDRFIGQFNPEYSLNLRRYERALKQRNSLLKNRSNGNNLFVWDVALSRYGAAIIAARRNLIETLKPLLQDTYQQIAHTKDVVAISYSYTQKDSIEQKLLSDLHRQTERDFMLGYTTVGPHRHDMLFDFNGRPAAEVASRGEIRTIVLALKFLEVDIIKNSTDKMPIILLDDVFSELDESRQAALMNRFSEYQTIITSVSAPLSDYSITKL